VNADDRRFGGEKEAGEMDEGGRNILVKPALEFSAGGGEG